MSAEQLQAQVSHIATTLTSEVNTLLAHDRYKDALTRLNTGAKELRIVRSQIVILEREIRAGAQNQRRQIAKNGQLIGLVGGSKVRRPPPEAAKPAGAVSPTARPTPSTRTGTSRTTST